MMRYSYDIANKIESYKIIANLSIGRWRALSAPDSATKVKFQEGLACIPFGVNHVYLQDLSGNIPNLQSYSSLRAIDISYNFVQVNFLLL